MVPTLDGDVHIRSENPLFSTNGPSGICLKGGSFELSYSGERYMQDPEGWFVVLQRIITSSFPVLYYAGASLLLNKTGQSRPLPYGGSDSVNILKD